MPRLAPILALAALLAACGGDGKGPDALPSLSAEGRAFRDLGLAGAEATVRIVYRVAAGDETSEVIVAQRPPQRSFRVTEGQTSLIVATEAGDVVTCGQEECFRIPGLGSSIAQAGAAILGPLAQGFDMFHGEQALEGYAPAPGRTIAGREATCGTWKPEFSPDGFTMCLDAKTGIALLYEIASGNIDVTLEATEVGEPGDDDFEPLFPVTDLPTGYVPPSN
ncbi:MAG TPA: hypothetical protein VM841_06100 [Actinomycetota bacterium]|nr:hypothetical protein [Actinomycetota bacterium]